MSTIKITTSQNIDLEYELGSLGDRIVARLIDLLIIIAYSVILLVFANFAGGFGNSSLLFMFILIIPIVFYDIVFELILHGQSPGKKARNIKVISISGDQPSFGQYLIRWLFRILDFTLTNWLLALIMVAVSEKKQRLGDLIAGTVLIKTTPRTALSQTIYVPPQNLDYTVTYPEVINLKDSDIELIKEVLRNFHGTGNTALTYQAQKKIEQVLHIASRQAESWDFLGVILKDYYFITSQL